MDEIMSEKQNKILRLKGSSSGIRERSPLANPLEQLCRESQLSARLVEDAGCWTLPVPRLYQKFPGNPEWPNFTPRFLLRSVESAQSENVAP